MEKFYKNFKIARIVLCILIVLFVILQFFVPIFLQFALITACIVFVLLAVNEVFKYKDLQKRIRNGYDLYLLDYYKDGFITKQQLEDREPQLYPEYLKLYRKEKAVNIIVFLFCFGIAMGIVFYLLKTWF